MFQDSFMPVSFDGAKNLFYDELKIVKGLTQHQIRTNQPSSMASCRRLFSYFGTALGKAFTYSQDIKVAKSLVTSFPLIQHAKTKFFEINFELFTLSLSNLAEVWKWKSSRAGPVSHSLYESCRSAAFTTFTNAARDARASERAIPKPQVTLSGVKHKALKINGIEVTRVTFSKEGPSYVDYILVRQLSLDLIMNDYFRIAEKEVEGVAQARIEFYENHETAPPASVRYDAFLRKVDA
jgi:hypothetical protein